MDLRDETREVEQIRWASTDAEHAARAKPLAKTQGSLGDRVGKCVKGIRALKDGDKQFAKEIALLRKVHGVMGEAHEILAKPDTGPAAIGAETEAIELLLQARKASGKGGGGGGSSPGRSNGGGDMNLPALALMGRGTAPQAKVEARDVKQEVGSTKQEVPEEFRRGVQHLLNELERGSGGK